MRNWKIPVYWEMCTILHIGADTLEEAMDKAYNADIPLPDDGEYVTGSWEVPDSVEEVREWYNDNAPDDAEGSHSEEDPGKVCDLCTEEVDEIEIDPIDISDFLQINA